ncbi:MAG: methyltransferase domain-containing protein [Phycisphaerales bacterium]
MTPLPASADMSKALCIARLDPRDLSPRHEQLDYSVRRYFVDEFFERHARTLPPGARVVDVGGVRGRKRGQFDIGRFDLRVTVVNTSPAASPDVLADACSIPLDGGCADVVVLAEVIEHLEHPAAAIAEAARLLAPGGVLLATAPFLFRVHPDPIDVGRYTPQWWRGTLTDAGFAAVEVEQQGMLPAVLAEFVRGWFKHLDDTKTFWPGVRDQALGALRRLREQAIDWERRVGGDAHEYMRSYATGYGVRAVKP